MQAVQVWAKGIPGSIMAPKRARSPKWYWTIGAHIPEPGRRYWTVESYHNPNMQHPATWYEEHVDPPAEPTGLVWKWSPAERRFVCEVTPIAGIGNNSAHGLQPGQS